MPSGYRTARGLHGQKGLSQGTARKGGVRSHGIRKGWHRARQALEDHRVTLPELQAEMKAQDAPDTNFTDRFVSKF